MGQGFGIELVFKVIIREQQPENIFFYSSRVAFIISAIFRPPPVK
jgi:hypothetical protein